MGYNEPIKDWDSLNIKCDLCDKTFIFEVPGYGANIINANRIHIECPCCKEKIVINNSNTTISLSQSQEPS